MIIVLREILVQQSELGLCLDIGLQLVAKSAFIGTGRPLISNSTEG